MPPESEFDCIIVLGHSAREDDPVMQARVRRGVELYEQGLAPCLIMSGLWSFKLKSTPPPRPEAWVMRDLAVALGVPAEAILVEDESTDTLSNAFFCRTRFLDPLQWCNVCVVTSEVHAQRALWLFARVLGPHFRIEVREAPSVKDETERREGLARNTRLLRQIQDALAEVEDGDAAAIADLLFTRHPGYVDDEAESRAMTEALV